MSQNVHSEIIIHVFSIHMPAMQLFRIIGEMSADASMLSLGGDCFVFQGRSRDDVLGDLSMQRTRARFFFWDFFSRGLQIWPTCVFCAPV